MSTLKELINFQPFPDLACADEDGLLAMGGDLSVDTLVSAYTQGVFPWFNEGQPILWWSPDPRLVLYPDELKVSRSLRKNIKNKFTVSCNTSFEEVIEGCALRGLERDELNKESTWITADMHRAYSELFLRGYAHSVEVWSDGDLVGGLYGVCLGRAFFGESMFSRKTDASKTALAYLCQHMANLNYTLIDCQVASEHLLSLGAKEISRNNFTATLVDIDMNKPNSNFAENFPRQPQDLTMILSPNSDIKKP